MNAINPNEGMGSPMNIQHPFQPNDTITLAELMGLIEHEHELLLEQNKGDQFGFDVAGHLNGLLNGVLNHLSSDQDKAAFVSAATERFIGE
jgi:hypothetical protein